MQIHSKKYIDEAVKVLSRQDYFTGKDLEDMGLSFIDLAKYGYLADPEEKELSREYLSPAQIVEILSEPHDIDDDEYDPHPYIWTEYDHDEQGVYAKTMTFAYHFVAGLE